MRAHECMISVHYYYGSEAVAGGINVHDVESVQEASSFTVKFRLCLVVKYVRLIIMEICKVLPRGEKS